jgi:hypothetical protein
MAISNMEKSWHNFSPFGHKPVIKNTAQNSNINRPDTREIPVYSTAQTQTKNKTS